MREKEASSFRTDRVGWAAGAAIAFGAVVAYGNSFHGAFVYDDQGSILSNKTIEHWSDLKSILATPGGGTTAQGRPLLNLSLALNHAIGGTSPVGYHVVNLVIHAVAGLLLFGIIRRTLRNTPIAFVTALLWTVHPLQTEAVTYVVQRAESLMGMLYLLTLYAFVRGGAHRPDALDLGPLAARTRMGAMRSTFGAPWLCLSWAACVAGMATKEVMVSAPVILFLYDRTFIAGSFPEAWRQRARFYLALAATWLLLAGLVVSTGGNRGGSVGFGVGNPWWAYALTQFIAIAHYLRMAFWPFPLVFDYGAFWVRSAGSVLPSAVLVTMLGAASAWAFFRPAGKGTAYRAAGFAGIFFFAILAPTSLLPGTTQMIVEHRMYLPLAAVLVVVVACIYGLIRRKGAALVAAGSVLAVGAACATRARNDDYRSAVALWTDTVNKRPGNAVAYYNLGYVQPKTSEGQAVAEAEYRRALELDPLYWGAEIGLGDVYSANPAAAAEAARYYRAALRINPKFANAYISLGNVLAEMPGQTTAAIEAYRTALRLNPGLAEAHYNLGIVLATLPGGTADATQEYRAAIRLRPDYAEAHNNLGMALAALPGGAANAAQEYRTAIQLRPNYAEAHNNLANLLATEGRPSEAVAEFEAALRAEPNRAEIHYNAALVLLSMPGHAADAAAHLQAALRLRPDFDAARQLLAQIAAAGP